MAGAGALVAAGLLVTGTFKIGRSPTESAVILSGDDVYTGSILYMPGEGNICRQLLFDNRTGRIQDNGPVNCDQALAGNGKDAARQWSTARALVIGESFRQH